MSGSSTLSWAPAAYWSPPVRYPHSAVAWRPPHRVSGRLAPGAVVPSRALYFRDPGIYRSRLGQIPTSAAELQARIQAEVGTFLAARQQLDQMQRRARTANDLALVQALQAEQASLETELPDALNAARALQAGQFNLSLGAQVVGFAARMEDHLRQVRSLRSRLGLAPAGGPAGIPWTVVLIGGGSLLFIMVMRATARR
jgi:multidrug efflux pump subunit AcrA (membrane-fusion protein)